MRCVVAAADVLAVRQRLLVERPPTRRADVRFSVALRRACHLDPDGRVAFKAGGLGGGTER